MKLIFCIDDKKGMMFFGKRQSQDSVLREWIINHTASVSLIWNIRRLASWEFDSLFSTSALPIASVNKLQVKDTIRTKNIKIEFILWCEIVLCAFIKICISDFNFIHPTCSYKTTLFCKLCIKCCKLVKFFFTICFYI